MICHWLQTCISLYSGRRDQSRTVNRSSPFLPLYFALATWPLKKGLGRLAPLGNFGTDPLQVMFTKHQVEFTCYVNSAERTKFLFFSCVVSLSLSLSFSLLPLRFLHEAFSQAGKHSYSLHVLNLIRSFCAFLWVLGHVQPIFRVNCWCVFPLCAFAGVSLLDLWNTKIQSLTEVIIIFPH